MSGADAGSGAMQEVVLLSEKDGCVWWRVVRWPLPVGRDAREDLEHTLGLLRRPDTTVLDCETRSSTHRWAVTPDPSPGGAARRFMNRDDADERLAAQAWQSLWGASSQITDR